MADAHLNHPADHINQAQAMTRFLTTAMGEFRQGSHLDSRDLEGLAYILGHIEDNLKAALTRL